MDIQRPFGVRSFFSVWVFVLWDKDGKGGGGGVWWSGVGIGVFLGDFALRGFFQLNIAGVGAWRVIRWWFFLSWKGCSRRVAFRWSCGFCEVLGWEHGGNGAFGNGQGDR